MFVTTKTHQAVADENIRLKKINDELIRKNETISDDLRTKYERDTDAIKYDHDRSFKRKSDEFTDKATAAEHLKAKLENEITRVREESEARIALIEDIHQDEILGLEEKYEAKIEAMEITYQAKKEALDTMDNADDILNEACRQEVLAKAEKEWSDIIQKAMENCQIIYRNALELLIARMKDIPTMTPAEITSLIKASTENYPALPETLTSTSSSK